MDGLLLELDLLFQPVVAFETGHLVGAEARVRWHYPRLGLLPAAEFLGIAEQCGLIEDIGEWVLASTCREALQWTAPSRPPLPVSVNLSSREFVGSHLVPTVRRVLETTGLAPAALKLEFQADGLVERGARARPILDELRQLGVGLLIDGYGTGRVSFQDVCNLPLTGPKLDRILVAKVGSEARADALASVVVAMARGLDLELVAVGIETAAQADALRRVGCPRGQGFYLGTPMTPSEFRDLLRAPVAPASIG